MTQPDQLQQIDRTYVRFKGQKLSFFGGCDYFRLSSHPAVLAALKDGLEKHGLNVAASRLTTGNHEVYGQLEKRLAKFFGAESALLVSSGYVSSLVAAQALAGGFTHALIDADSHAALFDAAKALDCPVVSFPHRSSTGLSRVLKQSPRARPMVLTDGMFSHDGSSAPLNEYLKVLPKSGWILIDDAHGAGILGKSGKGTLEYAGVNRERIVQAITLSKALGAYGGAILGRPALRKKMTTTSRAFIGSTPIPLPLAHAASQSLQVLQEDPGLRRRLNSNAAFVKQSLMKYQMFEDTPGPIVSFTPPGPRQAVALKDQLMRARIYPPLIQYLGGKPGYYRFVISSEHTQEQLERLVNVLAKTLSQWTA